MATLDIGTNVSGNINRATGWLIKVAATNLFGRVTVAKVPMYKKRHEKDLL